MKADEAFEVEIRSSGKVVSIPPDCSVVEALSFEGVFIATSCEQGVCGTCVTTVLSGVPDHRDQYFTPEERSANDRFTPCCSRSLTPVLRLDL